MSVVDWNAHRSSKAWPDLEQAFSPVALAVAPWTPGAQKLKALREHLLVEATLKMVKTIIASTQISLALGPMTPLRQNADFASGKTDAFLISHWPDRPPRAGDFFKGGEVQRPRRPGPPGGNPKYAIVDILTSTPFPDGTADQKRFHKGYDRFQKNVHSGLT